TTHTTQAMRLCQVICVVSIVCRDYAYYAHSTHSLVFYISSGLTYLVRSFMLNLNISSNPTRYQYNIDHQLLSLLSCDIHILTLLLVLADIHTHLRTCLTCRPVASCYITPACRLY